MATLQEEDAVGSEQDEASGGGEEEETFVPFSSSTGPSVRESLQVETETDVSSLSSMSMAEPFEKSIDSIVLLDTLAMNDCHELKSQLFTNDSLSDVFSSPKLFSGSSG